MAVEIMLELATRVILGHGSFPAGSPDPSTIEIREIAESELPKFDEPGTKTLAPDDATVLVEPPPPPPVRFAQAIEVSAQARTTDAAPAEVLRFPTAQKHVYRATLRVCGIDAVSGVTRDSEVRMVFKRAGPSPSQVGATTVMSNMQDTAAGAWRIVPSVDGADLVVSVQGAADRTVDWRLDGEVGAFAPEGLA